MTSRLTDAQIEAIRKSFLLSAQTEFGAIAIEQLRDDLAASRAESMSLREAADLLANAVALMNSMIRSGESHSSTSERVMREALDTYRATAAPPSEAQSDE